MIFTSLSSEPHRTLPIDFMRTRFTSPGRRSAGYALLMVMTLAAVSIVIMAATLSRTMTESKLNDMNNQYVASLYAAEAGTEQVIAR